MKNLFLFFYNLIEDNFHLWRIKRFLSRHIFLKDPIIFDIGSHRGKLVKLMNGLYENSSFYCFEPNKSMNASLQKIGKNVKVFNYAVGQKNGEQKILISKIDLTHTLSKINKDSLYLKIKNFVITKSEEKVVYKKIEVISLKNFCKIQKIKCIDFLKVDVEGYEYEVLKGAKEIIKNVKFIMLEVQKNDMYANYSKNKIENFLKKNNFILIKSFDFPLMFFKDCIYKKIED